MELAVNQPFDLAGTSLWARTSLAGSGERRLVRERTATWCASARPPAPTARWNSAETAMAAGSNAFRMDHRSNLRRAQTRPRHSEVGGALSRHAGNARRPMGMPGVLHMFRQHQHPRNPSRMERISAAFGTTVSLYGRTRHTFPKPNDICNEGPGFEKLKGLRLGLDKETRIHRAARRLFRGFEFGRIGG